MNDFLRFRKMVSYDIIRIVYLVGAVVLTLVGVIMTLNESWASALMGFALIIGGNVAWRIYCELIILFFSAHEQLTQIRAHFLDGGRHDV